jgi:hypothetical protein
MSFTHGMIEYICRPCYISILKGNIQSTGRELRRQLEFINKKGGKKNGDDNR